MEIKIHSNFDVSRIGRRKEDLELWETYKIYQQLMEVGQLIMSEMNLEDLFQVIIKQTNRILGTERSTLFLYEDKSDTLWSLVATGFKRGEIRINSNHGIAGWTFQNQTAVKVDDAYADERFDSYHDRVFGYRTRNILCIPICNRSAERIGVIQTLNKTVGAFVKRDIQVLTALSHYMAIALENAALYRDVKQYSRQIEKTLLRIETLSRVKSELTKFVPHSVKLLLENRPEEISLEKAPRQVSVLFVDIVGFASLTERYDYRLVNEMVERYFSVYLDCIQAAGGEMNENTGDGLMVIFDSNTVHDHAMAALKAGQAIINENHRLNSENRYPWGNVTLHLGVNSGTALVGCTRIASPAGDRYTYTASGLVTVLAARIAALSSGSLYCGETTYQYVSSRLTGIPLGKKVLKNVVEPVSVYRISTLPNF
ncbi:MAG: GAF domain-containing protein [Desulfobacteraceae bacterium]|jgi:class 3 adenylate cyclase